MFLQVLEDEYGHTEISSSPFPVHFWPPLAISWHTGEYVCRARTSSKQWQVRVNPEGQICSLPNICYIYAFVVGWTLDLGDSSVLRPRLLCEEVRWSGMDEQRKLLRKGNAGKVHQGSMILLAWMTCASDLDAKSMVWLASVRHICDVSWCKRWPCFGDMVPWKYGTCEWTRGNGRCAQYEQCT